MDLDSKKIFKTLNPNKIWLPVILGIAVVIYLMVTDETFSTDKLRLVNQAETLPVILAFLVLLARDAGYVYRIRIITDEQLTWTNSIYVIILWEFASAVTPSVVGGTAVAVFILWKEGIKLGKSLAYVMLTAIFDNLFFVLAAPIALILAGNLIFPDVNTAQILGDNIPSLFYFSYGLIGLYTFVMFFALFINPRLFKWLLIKITSNKLLRRWRYAAYERGNEVLWASNQLKGKNFSYWFKISVSTIFIWSARYLMVNCLIAAFVDVSLFEHVLIFGKHIILWIVMLVSPTPGSSGFADYFFPIFFEDFLGDFSLVTGILWRAMTYYPYLLLGALFLPKWIRKVFFKKKDGKEIIQQV